MPDRKVPAHPNGAPRGPAKFRLLVVDNDSDIHSAVLAQLDMTDVSVSCAQTQRGAQDMIKRRFYDAILVDMIINEDGRSGKGGGKEVMRQISLSAPAAATTVITRFFGENHIRDLLSLVGISSPRLRGVIDKIHSSETWAADAIESDLEEWRARAVSLSGERFVIEQLEDKRKALGLGDRLKSEIAVEFERLCRQLFGAVSGPASDEEIHIACSPLEREGFSPSVTFMVDVGLGRDAAGSEITGSRCVLKLGTIADTREEVKRYGEFVRHGVHLSQRVELLGVATQQKLGAVCYSFAGEVFGEELVALDELMRQPSRTPLAIEAIGSLFALSSKNWYSVRCPAVSSAHYTGSNYGTSFDQAYLRLGKGLRKLSRRFREEIAYDWEDKSEPGVLTVRSSALTIPPQNVLGKGPLMSPQPACLVHGDMHGGNVLVEVGDTNGKRGSSLERVCLIDYMSAGPGPRCADVAALQASIRLADADRIGSKAGLKKKKPDDAAVLKAVSTAAGRESLERKLLVEQWKGTGPTEGANWIVLSGVVTQAIQHNFPDLTQEEYLASCLTWALRQFKFDLGEVGRIRMLAWVSALYAALK